MKHSELVQTLMKQYIDKNTRYGNNAHETYQKFSNVAYWIRISDKARRLRTLLANDEITVLDEPICDTIGDAITYCFMFAGDIMADITQEPPVTNEEDKPIDWNMQKTIEMMYRYMALTKKDLVEMADGFLKDRKSNEDIYDIVIDLYEKDSQVDDFVTPTEIILLACAFESMYIDRYGMEDDE